MNHNTQRLFTGGRFLQRRGAALLEMALAGMVLIPLTFGAIEFSDAFFKKNTLQGAAREGARAAIVGGASVASVQSAAQAVMTAAGIGGYDTNYFVKITNTSDVTISDLSTVTAGTAIKVRVHAEWGKIGFRPCGFMSSTKVINGTAVMRKES